MANNYTHFSFNVQLNNKDEREWVETVLGLPDKLDQSESDEEWNRVNEQLLAIFSEYGDYECLGFDWEIDDDDELWIHDGGGEGNVEFVVEFLLSYLEQFTIKTKLGFDFSWTCSCPRPGEFGGGAVVVSVDDTEWMNTTSWLKGRLG